MYALPFPFLRPGRFAVLLFIVVSLSSCSSLLTSTVIEPAMSNLQEQNDLDLVCEGAPAYLLMLDSMIVGSPQDAALLQNGIKAYSAYSGVVPECNRSEREGALAEKAKRYGLQLLTLALGIDPRGEQKLLDATLSELDKDDLSDVFWGTYGWLTWVKASSGSPSSLIELNIIEKIMQRLMALDESYENGAIPFFFGVFHAAKPEMFGGRPDLARENFEKALIYSHRRFLLIQTTYAETLARNTFDQQLHDQLLQEVLSFDLTSAPENTLANIIAQKKAERLLKDNFFD